MAALVPIRHLEKLDGDHPIVVVSRGIPYCVTRSRDGTICAFIAVCTHKNRAIVPLRIKRGAIPCPHHGATFDPTTGEVADDRGKSIPTGMPRVAIEAMPDGGLALVTKKSHKKTLPKKERKRVRRELQQDR